jgi:hypothetical protein
MPENGPINRTEGITEPAEHDRTLADPPTAEDDELEAGASELEREMAEIRRMEDRGAAQ